MHQLPSPFTILLLFVFAILAFGCAKVEEPDPVPIIRGELTERTIEHEGVERSYLVYLPMSFEIDKEMPMVLAFHGGGGTPSNLANVVTNKTLINEAEVKGVVLIFPEGIDKRWNSGRPEIFNGERSYDDVGFISKLIDELIDDYNVDQDRVYATGISNGGFLSIRLGLDLSNQIAAIAPVTAQIEEVNANKSPELPISIMIINGTDDPLVPYNGGCVVLATLNSDVCRGEILSTDETIDKFLDFNNCPDPTKTQTFINTIRSDNTSVEITRYENCPQGTETVLVKVIDGGHTWPGGAQFLPQVLVGRMSREINASEMIFDFFLRHSRN